MNEYDEMDDVRAFVDFGCIPTVLRIAAAIVFTLILLWL
jgi:hypothetical protein